MAQSTAQNIDMDITIDNARTLREEGTYPAVIAGIIDVGPQEIVYLGTTRIVDRVILVFQYEDGSTSYEEFSKTMGPKAKLRKLVQGYLDRSLKKEDVENFKLSSINGKPVQVKIRHNEKGTWANVDDMLPANDKANSIKLENEPFVAVYNDPEKRNFDKLPDFILNKMMGITNSSSDLDSIEDNSGIEAVAWDN